MSPLSTVLRLALLLVLAAGGPLLAQVGRPPAEAERVRFVVFALDRPKEDLVFQPEPGAALVSLRFFSRDRSPTYNHRGRVVRFFERGLIRPDPNDPRRLVFPPPAAVASIPEDTDRALLLFFPAPEGSAPGLKYQVGPVDDSETRTPPGSARIFNLTRETFAARYNGREVLAPPGLTPALAGSPSAELQLAVEREGTWSVVSDYALPVSERARLLILLFPPAPPRTVTFQIRPLYEEPPPPPPAVR